MRRAPDDRLLRAPRGRRRARRRSPRRLEPAAARRCCGPSSRRRSRCSTPRPPRSRSTTRRPTGSSSGSRPGRRARAPSGSSFAAERGHRRLRVHDRPAAGRQRRRGATRASTGRPPSAPATCRARSSPCRSSTTAGTIGVLEVLDRRGDAGFGAARHRARVGVRPPGGGGDPRQPRRARHRRAAAHGAGARSRRTRMPTAAVDRGRRRRRSRRPRRRRRRAAVGARRRRRAGPRAPRPARSALVIDILDALARRGAAARAADVPPVTDRPPGLERAVRRRAPRPRWRATGRGAASTATGRSATRPAAGSGSRSSTRGWRAPPGRRRAARRERRRRARRGETGASCRRRRDDVVGHGTACAGIIHGLAPEADLVSIRVLGADNRGNGGGFAAGLAVGDRAVGRVGRQPVAVVAQRRVLRAAPRARRRGVLPERAAGVAPRTTCRGELPVAVRGGRVGRGPRRARRRTPGSTTRSRRSSSGRTGSTWTSPGAAGPG